MTIYQFLAASGHAPEDMVGKNIVYIYNHKDCGYCLVIFGVLLSSQHTVQHDETEKMIESCVNIGHLNAMCGRVDILNCQPVKILSMTYEMLEMKPGELLGYIMTLIEAFKDKFKGVENQ